MSALTLLSNPLALLLGFLLFLCPILAYLTRRSLGLRALAQQAALDSARAQLAAADEARTLADRQLARRAAQLAALRHIAEASGTAHDSRELLDTIVDVARDALAVGHASIGRIDDARGQLTIVAGSAATPGGELIGLALPLGGRPGARPWQLDAPLEIADPCHDERLATLHDLLVRRDAGALLIVPLRAGHELLGTLNLAGAKTRHFDEADLDLAQALAGYAATGLANQRLREAALQAERAKSAILDAVSHEFRTPITAVLGFTELYQENVLGPVSAEQEEALEAIHRNAHRLLKLVDDLLDLARLQAGRLDMSLYPVEVGLCIREATALLAAQFQQKQLDLRLEIADDLPLAWADAMWLRRVLVNLLANALRYTSAGAITVRAFEARLPQGLTTSARHLIIEIEDTGRGIPETEQQLIFDAFQRADGAQRTFPTSSGSGLGLTISKLAIDQMDGQLALRSQLDQGSTFTIALHTAELAFEHPRV
ncbi:MAG TPA: HAMP domain-containing sensor histidine kinase [Roseiflexaceae bacterium]|nr:HAMP domain-containing sensor histidine kinase [Roseiflexaceae bacterium]